MRVMSGGYHDISLYVEEADSNLFELGFQEQNTVPSLRKALKDVAMEKDAAVVARVRYVKLCYLLFIVNICISTISHL